MLMKISKLLVLTALWLGITSSAKADVPDGVWNIPEPQGLEFTELTFDDYNHYVLYNPAAKMFFASGNEWSTRASISKFGYEIWFVASTESDDTYTAPEGTYEFWDNCAHPDRNLGEKNMFTDDGGSTWVDHAEQANYTWGVTKVADFTYRIQNVALIFDKPEFDGKYIGWKGDYADTRLYMIGEDEGAIDWKCVTLESYEAFVADEEAYGAYTKAVECSGQALSLKAALEEAEALGADITAGLAVYNNTESTLDDLKKATDDVKAIVEARKALKKALEDAKAGGFDGTADFDAVYAKGDATVAELKKALEDLNAALVEWGKGHATWEKPADMSGKIVNPTFDNGDCTTGWSGDAFGRGGTVADGAEHYSKNYDTYQKITGLVPGVYSIGVNGFYRAGNYGGDAERHWLANDDASKYAKLYGKVGDNYYEAPIANVMSGAQAEDPGAQAVTYTDPETEEEVTVYVPNTMAQGDVYFHTLNQYANKVFVAVDEAGELTIGVKKTSQIGGDWTLFDDFSLAFYGTGADACQGFVTEAMKNFSDYVIEEGTLYTASYLTAYEAAYTGEKTASTMDEVNAILNGISTAKADLDKNIELWKKLQALIEKAKGMIVEDDYQGIPETDDLADYIDMEYPEVIEAVALNNEELEAEVAKVQDWMDTMKEKSKLEVYEGKIMTQYIKNPGFDDDENIDSGDAEGWTIDRGTGGNITRGPLGQGNKDLMEGALGKMNYCFEAWHRYNWDVWQEVKNLPVGMYELQVQGYVRCEVSGYTRGDELVDPYISPVYLYMNNAMSQFPSVYSECPADEGHEFTTVESWTVENINGNDYPNSMGGAAQCFAWGMYKTTAYGLISKEGESFRIGVKMVGNQDWWCIWDSFELIYHDPTPKMVQPLLEAELAKINLESAMGKNVYEQAAKVKADAEAAIAAADGKAMFAALSAAYDLSAAILESTALFADLEKATEGLIEATYESENTAAIAEANALVSQIENGIANHDYEDADVPGLLAQIKQMKTQLGFPNGWENASDDNPADFTGVIENPNYEENLDGWSGTAAAHNADATNAEIFGKNYDYYQDIEGLPAGTYQVSVQAFYRAGGATEDYTAWVANPDSLNYAFVYAKAMTETDTLTYDKALTRLAAEAWTEDEHGAPGDGEVYCKNPSSEDVTDGLVVPNTMVTAGYAFDEGKYANNVVTFVLKEGDVLRIGLVKETDLSNNWTIFDNWQLTYFGKNSSKEPSTSGIETLAEGTTMKVEYFTLDGRKTNCVQKGIMIQKVTFGNGATIVKKIRK